MTGLRTMWGVSLRQVKQDFGEDYLLYLIHNSKGFIEEGLLELKDDALIATAEGKFLIDGIASDLFKLD